MSATNSPAMLTVIGNIFDRLAQGGARETAREFNLDTKLVWLTNKVGDITNTEIHECRSHKVYAVACCAFAWLESLHLNRTDLIARIADERLRQKQLFADRIHHFRTDSPVVDWKRKLRVLLEEVGEVAQAIDRLEWNPRSSILKKHFVTELIQVAAVCVAWLEALEAPSGAATKEGK